MPQYPAQAKDSTIPFTLNEREQNMKNMMLLISLLAFVQCAQSVPYTTYSWVSLSGATMTGEWDIDSESYAAGQKASIDTHLSVSFADISMRDYANPYFVLSEDRSCLFVSGTWNYLLTFSYITFETDENGIITWTGGPRSFGDVPGETYSGTGFFRNVDETIPVPDSGHSMALLLVGLGVLAGVGKFSHLSARRTHGSR